MQLSQIILSILVQLSISYKSIDWNRSSVNQIIDRHQLLLSAFSRNLKIKYKFMDGNAMTSSIGREEN